MVFDKEYFQHFFGIIKGTNLAPIWLIYTLLTMVLELWKDVTYSIKQFNSLRKTLSIHKWSFGNHEEFMDLYIYKGDQFLSTGILDFKIFQKDINRYMYIPYKSGHVFHTINNYVLGKIKRYIRYNLLKISFFF